MKGGGGGYLLKRKDLIFGSKFIAAVDKIDYILKRCPPLQFI